MALIQQRQQHLFVEDGDRFGGGDTSSAEEGGMKFGPIGQAPAYVRRDFVKKVYAILTVQLLLTMAIAAPFSTVLSREWIRGQMPLYYFAMFASLALIVGVSCCCQQAARTFPTNYLFLLLFTVCMAVVVGFVTAFYTTWSVVQALLTTAGVFLGLTAYACLTKTDFTGMGPYLFAALLTLVGFSLVVSITSWFVGSIPPLVQTIMAGCGALLFSMYIVYDTQLVIGGTHKKHQFDIDDYVFAALNLYLDIINLFIYILQLFGSREGGD